ncbi:MAG: hypothetical protein ABSA83_02825 [Verrucomicrobiota bacterium]|jgi:hypothetical protein
MNIFVVILVWLIMAALLVTGVVLAVKGIFWLLAVSLIGFVLALVRYGIFSH